MNVLIIGSGGREQAMAWQISKDSNVNSIWVCPGNPGTHSIPKAENATVGFEDFETVAHICLCECIDLVIVGPEAPLADGLVDYLQAAGYACFGPSQAPAQLESSKAFCKDFMQQHHIPTASYAVFDDLEAARAHLATQAYPLVLKADGLAAGKGVIIAQDQAKAEAAAQAMMADKRFGKAGSRLVVEAFLTGREASFIAICDGKQCLPLASSQDHKARDDGNQGPNTGGMGAFSPSPLIDDGMQQRVIDEVIQPTLDGMAERGTPFVGFLYAGLMISPDGNINVLEFNVRMGDPETQPLMMRLKTSLASLCLAALNGTLAEQAIEWDPRPALGVVLASPGYPEAPQTGATIEGYREAREAGCEVFHAGTASKAGQLVTDGGRVLCVTALGDDMATARQTVYQAVEKIQWPGMHYRTDVGID